MQGVDAALHYLHAGYSVIPMNHENKKPLVKWAEYQNRLPTVDEIQAWWEKTPSAMFGIVTGNLSGIAVVDCDDAQAIQTIQGYLPENYICPIATTPRGGRHFYFEYPKDGDVQTVAGIMPHCDVRGQGGVIIAPPSANSIGKAYAWIPGRELRRNALTEMPALLTCALKGAYKDVRTYVSKDVRTIDNCVMSGPSVTAMPPLFSDGCRDNDLFTLANSLVKSGMSEADIRRHLVFIMNSWGEYDETWINAKLQSALKRQSERTKSLSEEIKEYVLSTEGRFLSTDVHRNLDVSTRVHKKNCSEILRRLITAGVIERCGDTDGVFRRVQRDYESMNLNDVELKPLDIEWPFDIHEKVYMLPKSVGIVAGETNAGKTAFCLNFAYLNKNHMKVRYLTSEMGCQEIRDRISKMGEPIEKWNSVEFVERANQFPDLVLPDGITVIDYLEKAENFYEIAKDIKAIFDKLKTGFCLIALQKKTGADFGRGGDFSAEKARLYLSMSPGKIKIKKAKNWVKSDENPNDLECNFQLVSGIKFKQTSGWIKSER